jgi:hypothetical protein
MQRMNERPMRSLGLSRRELFETIERDALIALPADDWEFAEWRRARVNLDYHIEVHDFLYSVPHALIRAEVDVRITARMVEICHRGQRVGAHLRRTHRPQARHGPRPHAKLPPALRRVDAGSVPPLGRQDRAEHRRLDQRRARQPAASRRQVELGGVREVILDMARAGGHDRADAGSFAATRYLPIGDLKAGGVALWVAHNDALRR